MIEIVR
jgi:hypothetical protein